MMISRRTFVSGMALSGTTLFATGGVPILGAARSEGIGESGADGNVDPVTEDPAEAAETGAVKTFLLHPVGHVIAAGAPARIRILEPYADALLGLDAWSHVNVLYWFDRNDTPEKRRILRVHPRGNRQNPLTGVFACRSPFRPNLIALTVSKLVSIEGPVVTVERIDALEGTPVLDLKPLIPADFAVQDLRVPKWAGPSGPGETRPEEPRPSGEGPGEPPSPRG
jgi:tRNA-Thr(GGU) m(6)t(6)A37 methyltransferase TsaA